MSWEPITQQELKKKLDEAVLRMDSNQRKLWNIIKIELEKWSEPTNGAAGNGFWIVAIFGNKVIWYNDIEEGFNCSPYTKFGTIGEYWCNQDNLEWTIHNHVSLKLST